MPPPSPLRRTLTHIVDLLLVPLILLSFGTGVYMWIFDVGGTEIHKWSSVAIFAVAALHLEMHWRMFTVHGKSLFRRLFRCPKKLAVLVVPKPVVVVVPLPVAMPIVDIQPSHMGWVIEVAPGWTQSELDEFSHIRSHFEEYGGVLDSLTLAHVRGSRGAG